MTSYGYRCHTLGRSDRVVDDRGLGCNLFLADGSAQFVQMRRSDNRWSVESEHDYEPDPYVEPDPAEPGPALQLYIASEMQGYGMLTGSSHSDVEHDRDFFTEITAGARRLDRHRSFRAVCGTIIGGRATESLSPGLASECESALLRIIKRVSQPPGGAPYRAGGAAQITWQEKTVILGSGDRALIIVGQFRTPREHDSCLMMGNCCSMEGALYLDSCREPTEAEIAVARGCVGKELPPRSPEFLACMKESGVKVGCTDQPDGSRICY